MADEMIELMDLSKVAKRSQSERGFTQREHFLLDHKGLKYTFINLSCFLQDDLLCFTSICCPLVGFFFCFVWFFFLSAHMQTLNALLHRKGLNVHRVCEVLSLIF